MTEPLRVLIADDQRLMREGLRILLEMEADIQVVGEAANGQEALELYDASKPDVVLMDVQMPLMDGVEATRRLCARWHTARIIILTTFENDEYVFEGLRAGASGYLLKDISGHDLARAIRTVAAGGALIEPMVAAKVVAEFARLAAPTGAATASLPEPLSPREREILSLVSEGLTNREIGLRLSLSEGTVKNYVTTILQKLGVQDRTQAALRARDLGINRSSN